MDNSQPTTQQPTVIEPPIVSKHFRFSKLLLILLLLIFLAGVAIWLFYSFKKPVPQQINNNTTQTFKSGLPKNFFVPTLSPQELSNWNIYTNKINTITLKYPPSWKVKEMHTLSNRQVDNPKEINTGVLSGKEGEITVEWGPMGFGGGCDAPNHKNLTINGKVYDVCDDTQANGNEVIAPFDNGHKDQTITEITLAIAYPPLTKNLPVIEKILSSLTFSPTEIQPGQTCGGNTIMAKTQQCVKGYHCQLGKTPDVGGICVKD